MMFLLTRKANEINIKFHKENIMKKDTKKDGKGKPTKGGKSC